MQLIQETSKEARRATMFREKITYVEVSGVEMHSCVLSKDENTDHRFFLCAYFTLIVCESIRWILRNGVETI